MARSGSAADEDRLRAALLADLRRDPRLPGEALAVDAPGLRIALAVGRADVARDTPLAPGTPFRIASVSKTFVAAAVLRLVEGGRLSLRDPVATHLTPGTLALLRADGYDPDRITVRQLLRHTAGLFDYASTDTYDERTAVDPGHVWTREEQLRLAMDLGDPVAAPGAAFHYSDTGYVLLGEIIEQVTGRPLAMAVRDLLHFERIGLADTYWEKLEAPPPGAAPLAHQYDGAFDNAALDASHDLHGGGGLVSTVADLVTFWRALFTGKVFREPRTLDTMTRVAGADRAAGAGLGVFTEQVAGERCYRHAGYWGTLATYCPRLDLAFARTTNQADDRGFDLAPLDRAVVDLVRAQAAP
jgi:D-alanyl-D-alanine carboxypeptidase